MPTRRPRYPGRARPGLPGHRRPPHHDRQSFGSTAVVRQGAGDPAQDGRGRTFHPRYIDLADGSGTTGRASEVRPARRGGLGFPRGHRHSRGLGQPRPGNIYDLACSQSLLSGVASDAGSGLTAADGQAEADKAMESLRRAVAAGWNRRAHMRADTDLDPVRYRPDFRACMMDLVFPTKPFTQ